MTTAAVKFFLAIALGVLAPATSATAPEHGTMELCEQFHVITVNSLTDGVSVKYRDSQGSVVSTTILQGHNLPPLSVCGDGYKRCNLHITSNYDGSIRVAVLPLSSGIGLVSYNYNMYSDTSDTLVYREQFVLTQAFPSCTYMYFTQTREVVGYCLDLSGERLYSLRIGIQHGNLSQSIVRQHNSGESVKLFNLVSLSNFVFFDSNRDPFDGCFPDEDGHIVCLENGEILDHSFSGEAFILYHLHIGACSNGSQLSHVGTTCKLVAHCSDKVFLFEIDQDQPTILSNGSSGQVFVCPNLQFVRSRNGSLSLHAENGAQTRKLTSLPLKRIRQGDCLIINNHYIFFATLVDGSTILANFTSSSYRQLGASRHAMYVPSKVKGEIGLVHNESDTLVYDLSLPCQQEPAVIPDNFILANYFSTGTRRGRCWCTADSGPDTSISQPTVAHTAENSNQGVKTTLAVVLPVVIAVILLLCVLIIIIAVVVLCVYMKHKQSNTLSGENGIQRHHVVNPLIQNKNTSGVQLDVLSNGDQKYNCDQKSTTSESDCGGSLGTTDLLLSSESRLDSRCLSETQNSNLSSELMLQPRPDNILSACTSEITNNSEYMHGQAPCLNRQSTGDHETSIGASVNCTEGSDSHPQAAYSGSQYPNRRLQQVGQENTRPIQCTSPRNSYHGSSIHAGARPSVDGNADSLVNNDDIDNRPSLHSSPIEATPDGRGSGRSYMAVPQHLFVSSANPHPDDVHRTHQRREGRANEEDFGTLVGYALANGEPNNDTARVE